MNVGVSLGCMCAGSCIWRPEGILKVVLITGINVLEAWSGPAIPR